MNGFTVTLNSKIVFFFLIIFITPYSFAVDFIDDRPVFVDELDTSMGSLTYRGFLECIETAEFPNDKGPREIDLKSKRLILTSINDELVGFDYREYTEKVVIKSIVINTKKLYMTSDKLKYMYYLLGHCDFEKNNKES